MAGSDRHRDDRTPARVPARTSAQTPARVPAQTPTRLEELGYRLDWLTTAPYPGSHRSRISGAGDRFFGTAPLTQGRDARRLDLRASATDPFARPWVREFRQRSRVPVMLLVDLSRSMDFVGHTDRRRLTARFARALGRAAFRRGDPFGLIAADSTIRHDLTVPPSVTRHSGERIGHRIESFDESFDSTPGDDARASRRNADGLLEATRWLPQRRSLVFLLSDGHLTAPFTDRLLVTLARHDVVVVLLLDSAERLPPARWGLSRLADLETGRERLVFLRPGLAERMAAQQEQHLQSLERVARRRQASMLRIEDELDLIAIARHFLGRAG